MHTHIRTYIYIYIERERDHPPVLFSGPVSATPMAGTYSHC